MKKAEYSQAAVAGLLERASGYINEHNPCRQFRQNLLRARIVTGFQSVAASLGWSDVIIDRVAGNSRLH